MRRIEDSVRDGKLFAIAMPRAGGKTSLIKAGTIWAILYGYRRWVCLIAATAPKAIAMIQDLQTIIETNPLLGDAEWAPTLSRRYRGDFPEVCYPIHKLERIVNRQRGQTCLGRPTRMTWNSDEIVFADIPFSLARGAVITATGLDGSGIRGQIRAQPDGTQLRPDLVLLDDPQTDEAAKSPFQTADRISLLNGAVLEMGPPGLPLAGLAAVTVIREGDVADSLLRDWHGIRSPMLIQFPVHRSATPPDIRHRDWWDRYAELLATNRPQEAKDLYAAHRCLPECENLLDQPRPCRDCDIRDQCMDAEAIVSWRHRKFPGDLSAVQHAMDRHIKNPASFAAEMQQNPLSNRQTGARITPEQIMRRTTGLPAGHVPDKTSLLTAGVDVHDEILYWVVCAWEQDFTGQIIQYGTYPEQGGKWFRQSDPPRPLSHEFPGMSKDAVIQAGLEKLCGVLLKHEFYCRLHDAKVSMSIENMLVDSGYKPILIYNVRRKLQSPIMQASRGLGIKAKNKPVSAYVRKPGWKFGDNWYVPSVRGTREYPHVVVDTNYWKTFVHRALAAAPGTRGALQIFGSPGQASEHEAFAEQVAASEYATEVFANGRVVCEYATLPGRPDNHWLDCLVYATAAASMRGCKLSSENAEEPVQTARHRYRGISLSEMGTRT